MEKLGWSGTGSTVESMYWRSVVYVGIGGWHWRKYIMLAGSFLGHSTEPPIFKLCCLLG